MLSEKSVPGQPSHDSKRARVSVDPDIVAEVAAAPRLSAQRQKEPSRQAALRGRRSRNGQDPTHIRCERRAEVLSITRHGASLVPLDDITVTERSALMSNSSNFQAITIGPQHGWDYSDPLPGLGEREQCVGSAALKQNVGLHVGNSACRIE